MRRASHGPELHCLVYKYKLRGHIAQSLCVLPLAYTRSRSPKGYYFGTGLYKGRWRRINLSCCIVYDVKCESG